MLFIVTRNGKISGPVYRCDAGQTRIQHREVYVADKLIAKGDADTVTMSVHVVPDEYDLDDATAQQWEDTARVQGAVVVLRSGRHVPLTPAQCIAGKFHV
jgi:hypothetical protein